MCIASILILVCCSSIQLYPVAIVKLISIASTVYNSIYTYSGSFWLMVDSCQIHSLARSVAEDHRSVELVNYLRAVHQNLHQSGWDDTKNNI